MNPATNSDKSRCELCGYYHTSVKCPDINAKRDPQWDKWDLSIGGRFFSKQKPEPSIAATPLSRN